MATKDKDTIYIDIDDEITGIIDKFKNSDGKVVALVLPKRASMFQSIVNMKLMKRAATDSKKHLVLITSEAGLMPLAGAAGVHVAKTLTSKPEIPSSPSFDDHEETVDEDADDLSVNAEDAGDTPIGDLADAGAAAAVARAPLDSGVETVELDNADTSAADVAPIAATKKAKKDNKLKVPNFKRFRTLLIIGGLVLILLIAGLISALSLLPKATINVKTDATTVPVDFGVNLSTTATDVRLSNATVPSKLVQQQKTYSQQTSTTGQKNNGQKASGTIGISAGSCADSVPNDIASGTSVTANNQTYILGDDVSFAPTVSKGKCTFQGLNSDGKNNISITAQSGGASSNYNGSFSIYKRSELSASGSVSGGTDNIVQTVSAGDINTAKSKISTNDDSVKSALKSQLKGDGYFAIDATYSAGTPTTTNSANVGDAATSVTVTENVTYTMFGAKQSDLKALLEKNIKDKIDESKQSILDDGLSSANFNVTNTTSTTAQLTLATSATAGPDLDTNSIKELAAGKKSGDVKTALKSNPDVTEVDVKLSPFWVNSVPKKQAKITVNIAKPTASASGN